MKRLALPAVWVSAAICLSMTSGCAQFGATLPSMESVVEVAKESAREPGTWIPLTAAAVILTTGSDDNISDWASDNTPVFGSQDSASDFSDDVRNTLVVGMAVSSVFAPKPAAATGFMTRRIAANALAFGTVEGIVEIGKRTFKRDRPNDRDDRSFPSGHSSSAFSSALLIDQNLNLNIEKPWLRNTIKIGTRASAAAVAWARVEANEHHPVDVLFSAALSNFMVKTFYKSIISEGRSAVPPITVETSRQGFMLRLHHLF